MFRPDTQWLIATDIADETGPCSCQQWSGRNHRVYKGDGKCLGSTKDIRGIGTISERGLPL